MSARQDVLAVIASVKPYRNTKNATQTYDVHECACCFGPEYACGWNKAIAAINAALSDHLEAEYRRETFKMFAGPDEDRKGPDEGGK